MKNATKVNAIEAIVKSTSDKTFINETVICDMGEFKMTIYNNVDGVVSFQNNQTEKEVKMKTVKEVKPTAKGRNMNTNTGDLMAKEGICYNSYCDSNEKGKIMASLYAELNVVNDRLTKGQSILKSSYSNIVARFTMGVVTQKPTVKRGAEIKLSRNSISNVEDGCMTINMLDAKLMYTHYKTGNISSKTKKAFTGHFGYNTGIKAFNAYCADTKSHNELMDLAFSLIGQRSEIWDRINEAKKMDNVGTVVDVVQVYNEGESNIGHDVCSCCGGTVYNERSHYQLDATKASVIKELKDEKYNLGNGRIVTLDENGDILDDTAAEQTMAFDDVEGSFIDTEAGINMDIFADDYTSSKSVEFYSNESEYGVSDYKESIITEDDVQDMWGMGGEEFTDEEITEYNNKIKGHSNSAKWAKYRGAYGIMESGEYTRATIGKVSVAGGWTRAMYDYEVSVLNEVGMDMGIDIKPLDRANNSDIATFYNNVGKAFQGIDAVEFTSINGTKFTKYESMWRDIEDGILSMEEYTDLIDRSEQTVKAKFNSTPAMEGAEVITIKALALGNIIK